LQGSYGVGTVTLPAAVNVDEANVIFGSCLWNNNNAQTDLILSNAKFQLTNTIFQNNAGDAVRAIFSQGIINKIKIDNYGGSGLIQKGGRTTIKEMKVTKLLGWALDFDLLAISNMSNYITKETTHSLRAKGSSEVVINEYKGKTTKRDIEVTGSEKPETRVVVSNAKEAKKLMYIVEPGALLKINGLEKRTK
jgi:hypothetical protein